MSAASPQAVAPSLPIADKAVRRILVCQLRQIGDVLLSTPVSEVLTRRYPKAEIHVFTEKKCLPMLQGNPHIHKVWTLDKKALPTLLHELAYYRSIAAQGFDVIIDLQQLPRILWLLLFSKAKVKLSFTPPWYRRFLYTHWVSLTDGYAADHKLQTLTPLGVTERGVRPRLFLSPQEKREGRDILTSLGLAGVLPPLPSTPEQSAGAGEHSEAPTPSPTLRLITVDATHRRRTRRWLGQYYARLMDLISEAAPDVRFLLPYGPGEKEDVAGVKNLCLHPENVVIPENVLSLRQSAACTSYASMHFGNCSAPRHMAVALDVPTLTVIGSTGPSWTFPSPEHRHIHAGECSGAACISCGQNVCPNGDYRCMTDLTPEMVLPVFLRHLELYGRR